MTKPTREAVAESYKRVTDTLCTVYAQANLDVLWNAYLSQEEELALLESERIQITESLEADDIPTTEPLSLSVEGVRKLRAENQALKDDVARLKTPTIIGSYERETIVFDQDEEDTLP